MKNLNDVISTSRMYGILNGALQVNKHVYVPVRRKVNEIKYVIVDKMSEYETV